MSSRPAEIFYDRKLGKFLLNFTNQSGEWAQKDYPDNRREKSYIITGTILGMAWREAGMGNGLESEDITVPDSLDIEKNSTLNLLELIAILKAAGVSRAHPNIIFELLKRYLFTLQYQDT